jgi:hypothetical protein
MAYGERPFGLRDIKLTDITGATQVDLPSAMTMQFTERLTTGELRGDDRTQAVVSILDALEWQLEAGGISLAAWALMSGRTATESGSTPNRTNTLLAAAGDRYPYFKIYGKMVGDEGDDDLHVKIFKAKITSPLQGQFRDGEFFVTQCSGLAVADVDANDQVYEIVAHETAADLPAS